MLKALSHSPVELGADAKRAFNARQTCAIERERQHKLVA